MDNIRVLLRVPAALSFFLVLPFMILEWVNRRAFQDGFPVPLFVMLCVLQTIFLVLLNPILQRRRAGNNLLAPPVPLLLRVVLLVLLAWFWTSILVDQMPCFLGVPNCD